jgi:NhaC family Na+:H+ antiporter
LAESVIVLSSLVFFVSIGFGVFKFQLQIMLLATAVFTAFMAMRCGFTWTALEKAIAHRMVKVMPAIFIMFTVGMLIAAFIFSGTIPMLIYYGMQVISPQFLIPCSFIICAVLSTVTGTGWGSAGTAGIALIGIGIGLGIPLPAVAGAVIGGATFGDKLSPLSDTTNIAAMSAGTGLYDHVRAMLWTTIPAAVIALIIYTVCGFAYSGEMVLPENIVRMIQTLDTVYDWDILLLIPFVIIFLGSILKKPVLPVMFLGTAIAVAMGVFFHGFTFGDGIAACATGFKSSMVPNLPSDLAAMSPEVANLIQRGGLSSMSNIILTIFCAYAFAGIAEETGFLERIIDSAIAQVKTRGATVAAAVCTAISLTIIGVSGYISLIMTGELFRKPYLKQRLDLSNLSRTCEDGGTMVCSIVPFSTSGLFFAGALGVPTLSYLPWHFMAFICPVLAIIYGYTGIGMKKLTPEEADRQLAELGYTDTNEEEAGSDET